MAESVKALPDDIQERIEVRKWDMRTLEGVKRFRELKARSLPGMALNGELVFESLIPGTEELAEAILKRHKGAKAQRHKGTKFPMAPGLRFRNRHL